MANQGTYTPSNLPVAGGLVLAENVSTDFNGLTQQFNLPVGSDKLATGAVTSDKISPLSGRVACTIGTSVTSTSDTDITGATVTVSPLVASNMFVWSSWDVSLDTQNDTFSGKITLDGVAQSANAVMKAALANERKTITQVFFFALSAGSHTIKMQAARAGGSGNATYFDTNTAFTYLIVGQ